MRAGFCSPLQTHFLGLYLKPLNVTAMRNIVATTFPACEGDLFQWADSAEVAKPEVARNPNGSNQNPLRRVRIAVIPHEAVTA